MASWSKDWGPLAAQLAQMGLPTLGKAVGTIAGGSIPIVGGFLPGVGENLGKAAATMIADALGVKPDPDEITAAIENSPTTDVTATLQGLEQEAQYKWPALAAMAAEETKQFQTQAEDTERARQWAIQLAATNSPTQWAAPILGIFICLAFSGLLLFRLLYPATVTDQLLDGLTGTLGAAFMMVVGYYFGSSAGARRKDFTIQTQAAALGTQAVTKPPVVVQAQSPVTTKKSR